MKTANAVLVEIRPNVFVDAYSVVLVRPTISGKDSEVHLINGDTFEVVNLEPRALITHLADAVERAEVRP